MDNKGQTAGLITALIFGIASLIIGVIIAFVIVSTLTDANLLSDGRTSVSVVNETGAVNTAGMTLDAVSADRVILSSIAISAVWNGTTDLIPSANYTLTNGVVTNATAGDYGNARVTYTYSLYNVEEYSVTGLNANFTAGVDNVSSKIPTVLLIAAVVLILGVLVLLVAAWQRMRMSGAGGL